MKSIYLFSLLFLMACHQKNPNNITPQNSKFKEGVASKVDSLDDPNKQILIEGAIGFITTSEHYQFGDTINIFGKEGKSKKHIIITDENQIFSLKCLSKDSLFYKVQFQKNEIGFIPKTEKRVAFQTWEEHILNVFSVSFNEANNPLLENPLRLSKKVSYSKDEFYHPCRIKGEWLQVKWGSESNWEYGWIKWRDGEKLLIEFNYFA